MVRQSILAFAVVAMAAAGCNQAGAAVALKGSFTATKVCPALQSIKKATNPGNVEVVVGRAYDALAQNADTATYYRIRIDGAPLPERWVASDCGTFAGTIVPGSVTFGGSKKVEAILALSWQPGFCESHAGKPECAAETAESFEAAHFTLHGLWPQPRATAYCNLAPTLAATYKTTGWEALPAVDLTSDTRARLDKVMPGTQSKLDRHEWVRHGTCYRGLDQEAYFKQAVSLVDEVNGSAVQALFAGKLGQELKSSEIRAAFDSAFGAGTGDRVKVSCKKDGDRQLIVELTIGLAGPDGKLADMTKAASGTSVGCENGIVDQVGLQ